VGVVEQDVMDSDNIIDIKKNAWLMPVLGIGIALTFFITFCLVIKMALPDNDKDIMVMMVGTITTTFTQIVSYYYGSSKGQEQTSLNNQLLIALVQQVVAQSHKQNIDINSINPATPNLGETL
jgi:uncharacterized membrane protein